MFELGLLLLDLMYELEMRAYRSEKTAFFIKDIPLQRNNLSDKNYLIFHDNAPVELNTTLIDQKIKCNSSLTQSSMTSITPLLLLSLVWLPKCWLGWSKEYRWTKSMTRFSCCKASLSNHQRGRRKSKLSLSWNRQRVLLSLPTRKACKPGMKPTSIR